MGEAQRGRERAVFFIPNSPRTAPLSRSTSSLFFFPHQRSTLSPQAAHLPQAAHHAHAHHDLARRHRRGGHPELDRHGTKREVFSLFFFSEREKKPRNSHLFFSFLFRPPPRCRFFSKKLKKKKTPQAILLAIQFINATIGWYETVKAADAVAALKASLKPLATVKRDGVWNNIDAGGVVPGDLVLLASGSAVPADCIVNEGQIDVDASALTGESLPITVKRGGAAQMGSTVVRGEVNGTVQHTGKDTFFGRTAMLLQQVNENEREREILE